MFTDLKEQQRLTKFYEVFQDEVKRSILNVVTENPDDNEITIRKKMGDIIEKYFDRSIGVEKMSRMLSVRGCISDPVKILKLCKKKYIEYYQYMPIPRVNSQAILVKISYIEKELENKIKKVLNEEKEMLGYCHIYWSTKKKILLEDYGIVWYTPPECNPDVCYD